MGSVVPFQDLNLSPSASTSLPSTNAAVITPPPLLIPKIEPKLEPLDSLVETPQSQEPQDSFFPDFTPNFVSNSEHTPQSQSSAFSSSQQDNVYSEYHRISELFRTAFAKRLQEQYGDVSVLDPDSRAIFPVGEDNSISSVLVTRPPRRYPKRSSDLVRVTDLGIEDQRYFRGVVRRTRMLYDALRIFSVLDEVKRRGEGLGRRARGDLLASSVMRDRGLWLNRDKRIVGSIPGVQVGDLFFFRMELCVVGLHGHTQAGIDYLPASQSSSREPIATSIIVSGGYEDDEDSGDMLIYTGHGGQDKFFRQCMHQKLEGGNLALERSMHYGIEVRVIRGFKYAGSFTNKIYVYDGLYKIHDCWFDVGKSGFGVYKYKLMRIDGQPEMGSSIWRFAQSLRTSPLSARPRGYLSLDISNKKEKMPVMLFNDIDNNHEPLCYEYLARTVFPPVAFNHSSNGTGCDCVSGCTDDCLCSMKNGGKFAYDQNGFLLRGKPLIFECGAFCKCPPSCRNRVSQQGVKNTLEIFRSRETGWGVRSLDLIHAGAFICEYAGVVLTRDQAKVFTMNGDSLIYPSRFSQKWTEWGDLSQIYPDYVRPSYPSIPPLDFAMDVSRMRNVACYMSQSSTPNVLVQPVLYDHNNLMFPHLMLFAMENIPPLRELSLDYGVVDEWTGKLSICN
ncbi:histone-lysine N-methyltransferase family member SUVH9 [Manihot esculenta]|uniref:SET domain-containing protein n=1 Tax=Manihot esculenta TaxID=3983 RepID=A0A251J2A7_MANES|nr:histone-lysine N-methyltransferase family member SUVH9 [Manihot esculenta]XP_021595098.1 histone-lysine N-methyltransferase family member SUVH9 [Manihot esculenta]XP_021595099.1 histone-lysine N-methyltransferase family member SUVH9 [Manihot esculenta]OAY28166.1 hypothetical protein MANES_15G046600v8 [Manihot esculenta]OAY28167.1 hypothetical protein MANES_15G046600v8 [Manihot esculenta]OAY28168.1 hypothetical protein MANES_15G046600v8 [Manihot esculenta]